MPSATAQRRSCADEVRALARQGTLAATVAGASEADRLRLTGATYHIAWPVVFSGLTQGLERRRGHPTCATSIAHLKDDCLDRFEDDVEAVVHDIVRYAHKPIVNLEAWIASRLNAATIDGHRRRRGEVGALQRPRPPVWLVGALGGDRWLVHLAMQVLIWVGNPATAGVDLWPTESWSLQRGLMTPDARTSIEADIETVLAAMRGRPAWYASYVERPLGRKHAPVLRYPNGEDGALERPALSLVDAAELEDSRMRSLAHEVVIAIRNRIGRGERPEKVVVEVIELVFGGADVPPLADLPHTVDPHTERLTFLLRDERERRRIVEAVLRIAEEFEESAPLSDPSIVTPV
jgi:hypothetical protein